MNARVTPGAEVASVVDQEEGRGVVRATGAGSGHAPCHQLSSWISLCYILC